MRGRRDTGSSNGKMIAGVATLAVLGVATAFFLASDPGKAKLSSFLAWASGESVAAEETPQDTPTKEDTTVVNVVKQPKVNSELAKALKEAEVALSQGEFDLAETKARKAKGIDPENQDVADILEKISSARQKVELARRQREHDKEIQAARDDLIAEKLSDATTHVDRASNAMPDSEEVPELRKEIAEAKIKLAELAKERTEKIQEYVRRGTVHYSKNEFGEAIELAERALGIEPGYEPAVTLKAEAERGKELAEAKKQEEEDAAALAAANSADDTDKEDDTGLVDLGADEKEDGLVDLGADENEDGDDEGLVDVGADEKEDGLIDLGADEDQDEDELVDLGADEKEDGLIDLGADEGQDNTDKKEDAPKEPEDSEEEQGLINLGADEDVEPPRPTTTGDVPEAKTPIVLWDDPLETPPQDEGLINLGADEKDLPVEEDRGLVVVENDEDNALPTPKTDEATTAPSKPAPGPSTAPKNKIIKAKSVEAPWSSAGTQRASTTNKRRPKTLSPAARAAVAPLGAFDKAMQKEDIKALAASLSPNARRIYFKRDEELGNAGEFFKIASDISVQRKIAPTDVKIDKDRATVASRYTISFSIGKEKFARSYIGRYEMTKLKSGWFISRVVTEGLSK